MLRALLQFVILIVLVFGIYAYFVHLQNESTGTGNQSLNLNFFEGLLTSLPQTLLNSTHQQNLTYPVVQPPQNYIPQNQLLVYTLSLINQNRHANGLANVSYSNITSAQQHSNSMLAYAYFSHWDPAGLKPYMRYTVLGGLGTSDENVAYIYNSSGINVTKAIYNMEESMLNNDSACCNNGHRNNILDPHHNQISLGIAYNRTTVYLTEDFIDNYVAWFYGTPSYNNGAVNLQGTTFGRYTLEQVEVSYDPPVMNMTRAQLDATKAYSFGTAIAGVGYRNGFEIVKYNNITTINASTYTVQGNNFDVAFNMASLVSAYGPGEYTIIIFLTNNTANPNACQTYSDGVQSCNTFPGATYTFFINSNGNQFVPQTI